MDAMVDSIPAARFRARRRELARRVGDGVVFMQAPPMSAEAAPPRPDPYLFYFTGFAERQAALLLAVRNGAIAREVLFCRARDPAAEQWEGARLGPAAAKRRLQIDEARPLAQAQEECQKTLAAADALFYAVGRDSRADREILAMIAAKRARRRANARTRTDLMDLCALADEMRVIKDDDELRLLRAAAAITCEAHLAAMRRARAGAESENELEGALAFAYRRAGARPAFAPIVAGGGNACVLHYAANDRRLRGGDLVLVDSGGERGGYCADVSRVFPARGRRFSPAARQVYQIVLAAQAAALARAKPGARFHSLQRAAIRVIAAGLRDLGVCRGRLDSVINREQYRRFYMHGVGHFMGIEVHDVGDYFEPDGKSRRLRAGMVITVEPGLYLPDEADIPRALRGIGVRIEDDVLITAAGRELLTAAAPKSIAAVEAQASE